MKRSENQSNSKTSSKRNSMVLSFTLHAGIVFAIYAFFGLKRHASEPMDVSISGAKSGEGTLKGSSLSNPSVPTSLTHPSENEEPRGTSEPKVSTLGNSGQASEIGGETGNSELNAYFLEVQRKIQNEERYPADARKRGIEATIELSFELNEQGQIIEIHSISQGKPAVLVEAALSAVKAAAPFSPPPRGSLRVFQIPIEFKIK